MKRRPAIIFTRLKSLGVSYDVLSLSDRPTPAEKNNYEYSNGAHTLFLLPSIDFDAELSFCQPCRDRASLEAAALAAGYFLTRVRGLPLDELEFCDCDTSERVTVLADREKVAVCAPKCKVICTKMKILLGTEEVFISRIATEHGEIRATLSSDCNMFSDGLLRQMCMPSEPCEVLGSAAYSVFDGEIKVKYYSLGKKRECEKYLFAKALASLCATLRLSDAGKIRISGEEFEFFSRADGVLMSSPF